MGRGLKYEIPGHDWRVGVDALADLGVRGHFAGEFAAAVPVVVEIGFGRGEFLLELAAKEPATAFLGVEVSFKRVLKMARKVAASELRNVRLVEARGEVVAKLLEPGSMRELWVNFSDPWPKDRHANRRLIAPTFVHDASIALEPGGMLHVATDDRPYALRIDEVLARESLLENVFSPDGWRGSVEGRLQTGYEADWVAAGRALHFFEYQRRGGPDCPSRVARTNA
jgi:tRNA (guanine-N7-)-methyltransferase